MSFENYPVGAVEVAQCLGVVTGLPEAPVQFPAPIPGSSQPAITPDGM